MEPAEDPGWGEAPGPGWKAFLAVARPGSTGRDTSTLGGLRTVWLSFTIALGMIGVVVLILWLSADIASPPTTSTGVALALVVVAALVSLGVGEWLSRRPLDCTSPATLAESYRQRFFLWAAVAELVALVAFVGFILSGTAWLYLIGLAVAWWQFARMAPTAGHLAADQEALRGRKCPLRLLDALAPPAPPAPPSRPPPSRPGPTGPEPG